MVRPNQHLHVQSTTWVCDFCDDPNPIWAYPCRDFKSSMGFLVIGTRSADDGEHRAAFRGPWAACAGCALCIENRNWTALAHRSMRAADADLVERLGSAYLIETLKDRHKEFDRHRHGPRHPLAHRN
jgi:hypothetical protein